MQSHSAPAALFVTLYLQLYLLAALLHTQCSKADQSLFPRKLKCTFHEKNNLAQCLHKLHKGARQQQHSQMERL